MAEEITIDKKPFAVDMKIVWACAAALVYGANMAADWRNKVENHMAQQAAINADIKKTPERVQSVERDVDAIKSTIKEFKDGQARTEAKIDGLSDALSAFKRSVGTEISDIRGGRK